MFLPDARDLRVENAGKRDVLPFSMASGFERQARLAAVGLLKGWLQAGANRPR